MKKALPIAIAAGVAGALFLSADWSSSSGNAQRDGWLRSEDQLSRESAAKGQIKLLYSYKVDPKPQRMGTPVMLTNIISWKGFKSLAFVAGASDVYSIDYSTGKPYFKTSLGSAGSAGTALCPGGITSGVTMPGGSTSVARNPPPLPPPGAAGRGRGAELVPPGGRGGSGRGRGPGGPGGPGGGRGGGGIGPNVWVVGPDGSLETLRQQDGDNKATAPVKFVPANSRVSDLMMDRGVIYAATENDCGGNPNALYAVDLTSPDKKVVSFPTNGSGFAGSAGVAASTDGSTVYGLIADGQGSLAGKYNNTVVALNAKDLAAKDYFTPSGAAAAVKKGAEVAGATPAVFQWNGRDIVVAGGTNGRIYLLDAASLGGADHHTPLAESEVFAAADGTNGIWNAFATWEDPEGNTRWIYASISGASPLKFPTANGTANNGSIVAFKVEDNGGKPKLTPAWISRDMIAPAAPAVTNGLVFALSTGQGKAPKNAVLYALDSSTGKEIWSSGQTATSYATGGLAVNASIVLFATHDSQIHAYGIPIIF
ncbi:MAG TPA: hypothetical protein VHA14_17840 [Bryobacteraceae bacterium]|nr:hypothetical protein [Bryobacteraceae bacterium]